MPNNPDGSNLQVVIDFAENLTKNRLNTILADSGLDEAHKAAVLSQYRQMQEDLTLMKTKYREYESEVRSEVKELLTKLQKLLHETPAFRNELLNTMHDAVENARLVNPLDSELMGVLASIWPDALSPELLPIFVEKDAPDDFSTNAKALQTLYLEKSDKEKVIFMESFLAVKPDIEAASAALAKQKAKFESIANPLKEIAGVLAFMNKSLGYIHSIV